MSGLRPQECIPVPYAGRRVKEVFIDLSVPSEHLWSVNAKDCDDTRFYYGGIYVDKSTKVGMTIDHNIGHMTACLPDH